MKKILALALFAVALTRLERRRDRYHIGGKGGDFLGFYSYGTYYFLFIDASA